MIVEVDDWLTPRIADLTIRVRRRPLRTIFPILFFYLFEN